MTNRQQIDRLEEINEFLASLPTENAHEEVQKWVREQITENLKQMDTLDYLIRWENPLYRERELYEF